MFNRKNIGEEFYMPHVAVIEKKNVLYKTKHQAWLKSHPSLAIVMSSSMPLALLLYINARLYYRLVPYFLNLKITFFFSENNIPSNSNF